MIRAATIAVALALSAPAMAGEFEGSRGVELVAKWGWLNRQCVDGSVTSGACAERDLVAGVLRGYDWRLVNGAWQNPNEVSSYRVALECTDHTSKLPLCRGTFEYCSDVANKALDGLSRDEALTCEVNLERR
jgi:hypothetical protein